MWLGLMPTHTASFAVFIVDSINIEGGADHQFYAGQYQCKTKQTTGTSKDKREHTILDAKTKDKDTDIASCQTERTDRQEL